METPLWLEMKSLAFQKLSQDYFQNREFMDIVDHKEIIQSHFIPEVTCFLMEKYGVKEISTRLFNEVLDDYSKMSIVERKIQLQIQELRMRPQPTQRTPEWYVFRHNLITASDAYKIFKSQATRNEIILKKCQPLVVDTTTIEDIVNDDPTVKKIKLDTKSVNIHSSLHWGQKYEPLSTMLYENKFQTKIGDFGCMQHPTYPFIGASPDGINILQSSPLFGRMLEVKNVVSREITGIPKNEYWIQMQLQMEVCDLDDCDFLETKFLEFEDVHAFNAAPPNIKKGKMIWFQQPNQSPLYIICPLDKTTDSEIAEWEEETVLKTPSIFMGFIYWKLEKFSCVQVKRDREWFRENVNEMERVWKIIEEERANGNYILRKPKPRPPRQAVASKRVGELPQNTCFLSMKKKI